MRIIRVPSNFQIFVPTFLLLAFCTVPAAAQETDDSQPTRIERIRTPKTNDTRAESNAALPTDCAGNSTSVLKENVYPVDHSTESKSVIDGQKLDSIQPSPRHAAFQQSSGVDHANIVVVLETSGAQAETIMSGALQAMLDRLCPVAMDLAGDKAVETWAYADRMRELPAITRENLNTYVADNVYKVSRLPLSQLFYPRSWLTPWLGQPEFLGLGNQEDTVMKAVLERFKDADCPTIVLVVTDGGVNQRAVPQMLGKSSGAPIFWEFIGFHSLLQAINDNRPPIESTREAPITYARRVINVPQLGFVDLVTPMTQPNYFILQNCERKARRTVDNSDFMEFDNFAFFTDQQIEERLMAKIPSWISMTKRIGILPPPKAN